MTKLDVKAINSTDSAYVEGDVVIITVKTDEAIQAPTVTTSHGAASTVTNVDDGVNKSGKLDIPQALLKLQER